MYPLQQSKKKFGHFLYTDKTREEFDDTFKEVSRFHSHAKIYAGKHKIDLPDKKMMMPDDIFIRHYIYRSTEQARQKVRNQVAVHNCFNNDDLRELSAFPIETFRDWQRYKRSYLKQEGWKEYFDNSLPYVVEDGLKNWIKDYSRRRTWRPCKKCN